MTTPLNELLSKLPAMAAKLETIAHLYSGDVESRQLADLCRQVDGAIRNNDLSLETKPGFEISIQSNGSIRAETKTAKDPVFLDPRNNGEAGDQFVLRHKLEPWDPESPNDESWRAEYNAKSGYGSGVTLRGPNNQVVDIALEVGLDGLPQANFYMSADADNPADDCVAMIALNPVGNRVAMTFNDAQEPSPVLFRDEDKLVEAVDSRHWPAVVQNRKVSAGLTP